MEKKLKINNISTLIIPFLFIIVINWIMKRGYIWSTVHKNETKMHSHFKHFLLYTTHQLQNNKGKSTIGVNERHDFVHFNWIEQYEQSSIWQTIGIAICKWGIYEHFFFVEQQLCRNENWIPTQSKA